MKNEANILTLPDRRIAYQQQSARSGTKADPGVIFLGGFGSDMEGTKATDLAKRAGAEDIPFLRFDYRGHGRSSGAFEEGTIGAWADDAVQVFDRLTKGPQILIGSSLGGWLGLLLARARPERVAGFLGIAAAPDFTEELIRPMMSSAQFEELERVGKIDDPTAPPGEAHPFTKLLLEEAKAHLVLRAPLRLQGPVHLIQGQKDRDVPWKQALRLLEHVEAPEAKLTLVKDGDHRMNRPQDLELMWAALQEMRNNPITAPLA